MSNFLASKLYASPPTIGKPKRMQLVKSVQAKTGKKSLRLSDLLRAK